MEDFVTFEIAKKLKEKGFSKLCFATYDKDGMLGYNYCQPNTIRAISFEECMSIHGSDDNCIDAPTISQVLKWLRDEKDIFIEITVDVNDKFNYYFGIYKKGNDTWEYIGQNDTYDYFEMYEEATLAGIEYVLDNCN